MNKKDLEKLKRQAEEGKTKAMFEYGIEIDDPAEQKKYLKKLRTRAIFLLCTTMGCLMMILVKRRNT